MWEAAQGHALSFVGACMLHPHTHLPPALTHPCCCGCTPGPPSGPCPPAHDPPSPSFYRLRKDPLDPIDGGTKVRILFKRLTDPEFVKREQAAKAAAEQAKKAEGDKGKKAGAWGGLPGRR